jgi:hypothetical protein
MERRGGLALRKPVQLRILHRQLAALDALAADERLAAASLDEIAERFVTAIVTQVRALAGRSGVPRAGGARPGHARAWPPASSASPRCWSDCCGATPGSPIPTPRSRPT